MDERDRIKADEGDGTTPVNPISGLPENRSGIVDGVTGAKSMARRVAQAAAGTGVGGHGGTGAEDTHATPGRVTPGSTGGDGYVGGSAMGDEGLGNADGPRNGIAG